MPTGLFWVCTVTVAVLAIVYTITDKPSPADQHYIASSTESSDANTTGSRAVPTLQFVVAVSRHGNRSPQFSFPKSQYQCNDTKYWPYGKTELTQKGRVQMYNLGKKFRSLYNGFLDSHYRAEEFKALSTSKSRTLQSAEVFLAGLFPPSGFQVWNHQLYWQPIPIFPDLLDRQDMVPPFGPNLCPRYREAQKRISLEIETKYDSAIKDFIEYVLPHTGYIEYNETSQTIDNMPRIMLLMIVWESLVHPSYEGFPLPEWSKKIYPEPLSTLMTNIFKDYAVGSETQIRFLQGALFQEIISLMQAKVNATQSPDRKMQYYSGHDTSIIGLQAILGVADKIVEIGSVLIYELHRDAVSGQFYVQVLYIGGTSSDLEPSEINIPDCDFP